MLYRLSLVVLSLLVPAATHAQAGADSLWMISETLAEMRAQSGSGWVSSTHPGGPPSGFCVVTRPALSSEIRDVVVLDLADALRLESSSCAPLEQMMNPVDEALRLGYRDVDGRPVTLVSVGGPARPYPENPELLSVYIGLLGSPRWGRGLSCQFERGTDADWTMARPCSIVRH